MSQKTQQQGSFNQFRLDLIFIHVDMDTKYNDTSLNVMNEVYRLIDKSKRVLLVTKSYVYIDNQVATQLSVTIPSVEAQDTYNRLLTIVDHYKILFNCPVIAQFMAVSSEYLKP